MLTRMQQRRGTASQWTSTNPTLAAGEIGFETDTAKFKIGTGSGTWTSLPYYPILDTSGNLAITGSQTISGILTVTTDLLVGSGAASQTQVTTNPIIVAKDSGATYVQAALINSSSSGSADYAAYGDDGTETSGWVDVGFTGSLFSDANYNITGKNDGYIFVQGKDVAGRTGNLVLATGTKGTNLTGDIIFATGGFTSSPTNYEKMRLTNAGNLSFRSAASILTLASTSATTPALTIKTGDVTTVANTGAGTLTVDTGARTGTGTNTLNLGNANATVIALGNANTTTTVLGTFKVGTSTITAGSAFAYILPPTAANLTLAGQTLGTYGTGASLTAVPGAVTYSGASALAFSAAGTAGQVLLSGGTGAPTWTSTTGTAGTNVVLATSPSITTPTISSPTITGSSTRPNSTATYSATPTVVDASTTELHALTGSYAAAVTINVSNLTAGRQVRMYLRNTGATQSTVTIAAGTATTYTNVNLQPATPGAASVTSVTLVITSGTAVVTVFNAGGTIGGSIG